MTAPAPNTPRSDTPRSAAPPSETPALASPPPVSPLANPRHRLSRTAAHVTAALLLLYFAGAYIALPTFWTVYVKEHPTFADIPNITHTKDGRPGDPLNIALVVNDGELKALMSAAGWETADPLSLRDDVKIAEAAVLGRPYPTAPVSALYLFDRQEDAAFEQAVGHSPRMRHHVRFWKTDRKSPDGRPVWIGSAIFDEHVGVSRETGQITHVTAINVDAERDKLLGDLRATDKLQDSYYIQGFHLICSGRNGGGDLWRTDGRLAVAIEQTDAIPEQTSASAGR